MKEMKGMKGGKMEDSDLSEENGPSGLILELNVKE